MSNDFWDWSETTADNGSIDTEINFAEFQNPDTVNDSMRAVMRRITQWRKDLATTRSSTGSGNAYAVTSQTRAAGAYVDGETVAWIADRANTAAATLNVNGRGAVSARPATGVDFSSGEIRTGTPLISFYRASSNEFITIGSGYHVNAMTEGLLMQSVVGRLPRVGDPVLSLAPTPATGRIRLTQVTQAVVKADYPELNSVVSGWGYPWGSSSTTFNLPPAAGYFLRFAATSAAIDTGGARSAGSTRWSTTRVSCATPRSTR